MLNHHLLDLSDFTREHPPQDQGEGAWRETARHELHLRPGLRVRLAVDQAEDIGYGLWRDEELADAGIYASEYDSIAFAQQLSAALVPQLSLQDLQHMVAVLSQALAAEEADRADPTPDTSRPATISQPDPEAAFLELLAQDIERHPERLQPLDEALQARLLALVAPGAGAGGELPGA